MPMLIFATLLFLGFLLLLGGLAWAGFRYSTPKQGPAPGCAGGCALGLALLALSFFAMVGFVVLIGVMFAHHVVEHPPFEHVQVERSDGPGGERIHLQFDLSGKLARIVDRESVEEIAREICGNEASVVVERRGSEDGEQVLHVDIEAPAGHGRGAWRKIERRLKELEPSDDEHEDLPPPPDTDTREY